MSTHEECLQAETEALGELDIWNTLAVMIYELGAVSQNLMLTNTQDQRAKGALFANAFVEVADLITQCGVMLLKIRELAPDTTLSNLEWQDFVGLGITRQLNRMEAYKDKEPRRPSINEG